MPNPFKWLRKALNLTVIPGRAEGASPESKYAR
jgi:hypothetical protein